MIAVFYACFFTRNPNYQPAPHVRQIFVKLMKEGSRETMFPFRFCDLVWWKPRRSFLLEAYSCWSIFLLGHILAGAYSCRSIFLLEAYSYRGIFLLEHILVGAFSCYSFKGACTLKVHILDPTRIYPNKNMHQRNFIPAIFF